MLIISTTHIGQGNTLTRKVVLHFLGHPRFLVIGQLSHLIDEAPLQGLGCGEPATTLHQLEQFSLVALAARSIGRSDVQVYLVKVVLGLLTFVNQLLQLVSVEHVPAEHQLAALVHKVHGIGVHCHALSAQ